MGVDLLGICHQHIPIIAMNSAAIMDKRRTYRCLTILRASVDNAVAKRTCMASLILHFSACAALCSKASTSSKL